MMSLVQTLTRSLCGGLGLLLVSITPFDPDDMTTGPIGPNAGNASPEPEVSGLSAGDTSPGPDVSGPNAGNRSPGPDVSGPNAGNTPPGPDVSGPDGSDVCVDQPDCIEHYLWSVYERTPKIDAGGAEFAWKDAEAAEKAGMSPMKYAIGGMNPFFRVTLYRALRTLDAAGFAPGIMCGFRDDYRQSITTGRMKAQNDHSFHGGSFRGGYGYGMAADIVSLKGTTRAEQSASTDLMWSWIDRHEKELGIGRPYLNRDPPHVAPIDGEEYATHRILPHARTAGAKASPTAAHRAPR